MKPFRYIFLVAMLAQFCMGCMNGGGQPSEVAHEDSLHIDTVAVLLPDDMLREVRVGDTLMMLLDSCDTVAVTNYLMDVRYKAANYKRHNHIMQLSRLVDEVYVFLHTSTYRLRFLPREEMQVWDSLHAKYPLQDR